MRRWLFLILIVCLIGGAGYYYSMPKPAVKIGYIGSLTGKFSDLGKTCRDGAILAVEHVNADGGVSGRFLELVVRDDGSMSQNSLAKAQELAEEGVQAIVGPLASSSAKALLSYVNEHKVVTVGPVISGDYMARKDDMFVKLYPNTSKFGQMLAQLAGKRLGLKNIAVVFDERNQAYSEPILASFQDQLEKSGGNIDATVSFNSLKSIISYPDLAKELLAAAPDGVLLIASPLDSALLSQQIRMKNKDVVLLSSSWAASEELVTNGGEAVEGIFMYVPFDPDSKHPPFLEFQAQYQSRFASEPSFCSVFNYDAVMLLARALENDVFAQGDALMTRVRDVKDYEGVQGAYSVDANGDADKVLILQTIKDGLLVLYDENAG